VSRPFLIVAVDDPVWSLQVQAPQLARTLGHPLADELEVVVDRALELPFRDRLADFEAVLFLAQDPLGPLYPRAYEYAQALERACDGCGVPLLGRPEPLSRTCKSRQLLLLRRAGLRAPRGVRLAHWRDALSGERIGYPFVLRYDCGHASGDEGFAGPFRSPDELLAARLPERDAWPERRGLAGLAAVEYVELATPNGLYRKHRVWALGDDVLHGNTGLTRTWFAHSTTEADKAVHGPSMVEDLHREPGDEERRLALAAVRATGVDLAVIDYSYAADGGAVVFDVNPYPSLIAWWAEDVVFQRRFVGALARLLERAAAPQRRPSSATA
jgi:hypothetical protein